MFTSNFNLAQDLYLASSRPISALEVLKMSKYFVCNFLHLNVGIFYLPVILPSVVLFLLLCDLQTLSFKINVALSNSLHPTGILAV